jgi:2-(1,2-epoxy-1,2-dihydrophenyl)acetyl-CoA isomerase
MTEQANGQIGYHVDGNVAIITLNRPDKLNAFTTPMLKELGQVLKQAERDEAVRAIVITGTGRGFCAGQDVRELQERQKATGQADLMEHLQGLYHPIIQRMRRMEKPIIAAINGVAAGAGASLALACDLRVASENALFIQAFVNVGLIPDSGSTFFLPRLVGLGRALELVFTGRPVNAEEAERLGIFNRVVPHEELMDAAVELARQLAQGPTKVIGLAKRALNRSWLLELEEALDYEAQLQAIAGSTEDHREGVAAFLEKRAPKFTGR